MKYLIIIVVLLLSSGAFMALLLQDPSGINASIRGDDRLQLMWAVIDFAVVILCFFHGRQFIRVASQQPLILAFMAWGILSLAWSDNPQLTVRRTAGLVCTTALGFFLGMRFELRVFLKMLAWTFAIVMFASVVTVVLFPSLGIMADLDGHGWRGVYTQKNELARMVGLALVVFTCLLWESRRNRLVYVVPLALGFGLIVLSRSMTGLIVTTLTLFFGFYRRLRLRPAQSMALFTIVLFFGFGVTVFLQNHMDPVFALIGRDSTLTGRTALWRLGTAAALKRPLLGAGWDVFWAGPEGDTIRSLVGWEAPHAHNAFIDMTLNVGLIGLAIFLVALFDCFRRAVRYSQEPGRPFSLWPLLFYSYMFLYFFTESTPVDRHSLIYILYCATSVSMNVASRVEVVEDDLEEEYLPAEMAPNIRTIQGL
jgi:exopolysaccharide production protein ExoQ